MSDQRVYLDDIYASKECQGSVFRAVVMMAHEARFLNNQAGQGYIQLTKKPTTIAMYKFKEGKLSMTEKASNDVTDEAIAATEAAEIATPENVAENAAAADAAFGG
jgi:DNA-directed RNA polymerase subunit K/omega